jgi:molybdopterin converting factor subunit 1
MRVTVRLFAVLRDRAGASEVTLDLGESPSAGDVTAVVADRFPQLRELLQKTAVAVNQVYATPQTPLGEGDEIALIPPVSGG